MLRTVRKSIKLHVLPNLLFFGLVRRIKNNADVINRGYVNYYWRQSKSKKVILYTLFIFILSPVLIFKKSNYWIGKLGKKTVNSGFKSVMRQRIEQYYLSLFFSIDAENYYLQEFYRPDGLKRARYFVSKGAIKRGVYNLLIEYGQQIAKYKQKCSLDNKVEFVKFCQKKGLPVVPVLLEIRADKPLDLKYTASKKLSPLPKMNLFCKPGQDNEGKGAEAWIWRGGNLYENYDCQFLVAEDLYNRLFSIAKKHSCKLVLVQPLVLPHTVLCTFRKNATPTVRIITYIDPDGEVIKPDVAMLRFSRHEKSVVDNASAGGLVAPINIENGVLGAATSKDEDFIPARLECIPGSEKSITGFTLPYWNELLELVLHAHSYFPHYFIIGWDVIITDQGPVILEGNSQPGLCYIQKAHLKSLGEMAVGSAMAEYVKKAENFLQNGIISNYISEETESVDFYQGSHFKRWLSKYFIQNEQIIQLFIEGKVQGVSYRKWIKKEANKLKLNGWVRNLPDGRVEAVIKGRAIDVEDLLRLSVVGPKNAVIRKVNVKKYSNPVRQGFNIIK